MDGARGVGLCLGGSWAKGMEGGRVTGEGYEGMADAYLEPYKSIDRPPKMLKITCNMCVSHSQTETQAHAPHGNIPA